MVETDKGIGWGMTVEWGTPTDLVGQTAPGWIVSTAAHHVLEAGTKADRIDSSDTNPAVSGMAEKGS
jgi:hypothetical protein